MKTKFSICLKATALGALLATSSLVSAQSTTTTTTTSSGTISEFSPSVIKVRTIASPSPIAYTYSKNTTYVDENGNAVSMETVKSGLPVTVYYNQDGDKMVASKVVVQHTTSTDDSSGTTVDKTKKTTTTTTPQ